jgi:hypothetical protein
LLDEPIGLSLEDDDPVEEDPMPEEDPEDEPLEDAPIPSLELLLLALVTELATSIPPLSRYETFTLSPTLIPVRFFFALPWTSRLRSSVEVLTINFPVFASTEVTSPLAFFAELSLLPIGISAFPGLDGVVCA